MLTGKVVIQIFPLLKKLCFTLIVSPKINLDWVYELYIEMHNVFADI